MPRRSGISNQVSSEIVYRYRAIRALWFTVQNQPDTSIQDVASEFYSAVGNVLEGQPLQQIELRRIDRKRVQQHIKEG